MANRAISLFDETGGQWHIKKHSSLVAMWNITTLLERKTLNSLIYIAKDQLKRKPEKRVFTCDLWIIKRLTGWEYSNAVELKNALTSLVDTKIEYNIFNKDRKTRWIFAVLAEATIDVQGSGKPTTVTFEFSSSVLETIKHPRIYVKLNLLVLRGLASKHSLALYEFLADYFNLGSFRCSKDDFRRLMWISTTQYPSFAMLRKRVLEVAVNEINLKTRMNVTYTLERIGKRIEAIIFKMEQKDEVLDQNDPPTAIREKLKSFGLSGAKITSLLEHHDEGYLWVNIAAVEAQWKKGKIKNVAGYLLQAFADDYSSQKPTLPTREEEFEIEQQTELDQEVKKKRFKQERRFAVEEYLGTISVHEKEQLREAFFIANTDNVRLQKLLEKNDFEHPVIQAMYIKWIVKTEVAGEWLCKKEKF